MPRRLEAVVRTLRPSRWSQSNGAGEFGFGLGTAYAWGDGDGV